MTPKNILIVDDDAGDRKLVRRLLLKHHPDAKIYEAESGEQALGLSDVPIEVVFVDYLLPGGTGLELISHFATTWPRALLFVITGQGDEDIAKSAILAGAGDYIPKSAITGQALKRMIANSLEVADMRWRIDEQQNDLKLFSDVLVHDLKAPIRAVKFFCDQILEDYKSGELEEVEREFDMMKKSVQKMSDLIEQLARHIDTNEEGVAEVVFVDSLFDGLRAVMAHDISSSDVQIVWDTGGLSTRCFAPEVIQLLQNLIGNSIKYRGEARPKIKVSAKKAEAGLQITVADNGVGVPAQYREQIFQPFKRLQQTNALPGSGLGLATCVKIAKRHKGRIWCDPDVETGTTIHFTLCLDNKDQTNTAESAA